MKIVFQILWVLSICFLASRSQERNNGFSQRRQLHSSGQVLSRSQSAQVKSSPNPRYILLQHYQNLAGQSLSRSTNSKLLLPKKQFLLKPSIPKKLAKLQTHPNKAGQPKLGLTEYGSKAQSRPKQPQAYQNNPIQKRPHFKSNIHNRPNSLYPGPLSHSKRQPQNSQSPPNPPVRRVIRPFKSLSTSIFHQKPRLNKHNPNPQTLQKTRLNKTHPNKFVTRRTRQRKPNPKALVQNKPGHTKTNLQPPGGRKCIQPLDPRKFLQPSGQGRRPQSSSQRRHPYPLDQKIPNPLIKVRGKIKPCIRPHIQNKPGSHYYHPHIPLSPGNPLPPPFIPSLQPQVQPTSKVVSTKAQVLNTTPFTAIATTTPHIISSSATSATTTNKISSDLISKSTSPSDITVSSPKIQVPATILPTSATISNAPATQTSTPLVTTTSLTATMQGTPFTTQEITTVHAPPGVPTMIPNTTMTFAVTTLLTTTSSATAVQNATAPTNTSSAADTEGITALRMTTESGYETTEIPYSGTYYDSNYVFENIPYYYE